MTAPPGQDSPRLAACSTLPARGRLIAPDDPGWTSLVAQVRHDFYHLPSYAELSANYELGVARAVLVEDGERTLLLPLLLRAIPGGGWDATSPYGYPGPIGKGLEDPAFLKAAFLEARRVLDAEGVVSLFVRFHPVLNQVAPEGVGAVVSHGDAVVIDLSQTGDVIWRQMRSNHRRQIARSILSGYTAAFDRTEAAFEVFKRLYLETMARLHAAPYYFFDDIYFDRLRSAMGERMHLGVVRVGGDVAVAGLFIEEDGIVEYHLCATDERFARFAPTKLMVHFVTGWAQQRNNRWFVLGAGNGAPDDPLLHFKAGFSPLHHPFRTLRMVVNPAEYLRLARDRDPSIDPTRLDGYFPVYRRR